MYCFRRITVIITFILTIVSIESLAKESKHIIFSGSIVYTVPDDESRFQIRIINGETGEIKRLTSAGTNLWPKWSPDGKKIIFTSKRNKHKGYEIYIMDNNGKNKIKLTSTPFPGGSNFPRWGSNNEIYFTFTHKGSVKEKIINLKSGSIETLTSIDKPRITPVKKVREYLEQYRDINDIDEERIESEIKDNSRKIENWISQVTGHYRLYISPNGRYHILYYPITGQMSIVDFKLSKCKRIENRFVGPPSWSTDSEKVAFIRKDESGNDLLVIYHIENDKLIEIRLEKKVDQSCGGSLSWDHSSKNIVYSCGPSFIDSLEDQKNIWLYIFNLEKKTSVPIAQGDSPDWK